MPAFAYNSFASQRWPKNEITSLVITNQTIADNQAAQVITDADQDGVIATKADQSALDTTNQTVADNKTAHNSN